MTIGDAIHEGRLSTSDLPGFNDLSRSDRELLLSAPCDGHAFASAADVIKFIDAAKAGTSSEGQGGS
jgi:hypothetical protein